MSTYSSLISLYLYIQTEIEQFAMGFDCGLIEAEREFNLTETDLIALRAIHQIVLLHRN